MSTGYDTIGSDPLPQHTYTDRPLFGQPTLWNRVFNWIAIGMTAIFVLITLLGAFISPSEVRGINIFFAICIAISCLTHDLLLYWYRQGDVDPKFLILIYSNTVVLFLSCICANIYIYWRFDKV